MRHFTPALLAALALLASATEAAAPPLKEAASVVLRYPGTKALGADDTQGLKAKALEILKSSNFNSTSPLWEWDEAEINLQYGAAVSRRHLLVTFVTPETIQTVGGKIVVKEIVIGLNGSHYASSLHTVDDQGRIVGHSKYSGTSCVELLELVQALPGARE
jgi:hypothetical protein